jgi:hypothetical protein
MQPVAAMALAINQISQFLQARVFSICHDAFSLTGHDFGSPCWGVREASSWSCHQFFTTMTDKLRTGLVYAA